MKLSKEQINVIANSIFEKLQKTPRKDVAVEKKIKQFVKEIEGLKKRQQQLQDAMNIVSKEIKDSADSIYTELGIKNGCTFYSNNELKPETIATKYYTSKFPTRKDIYDKIVLKGIFSKEEDLEKFIESIVSEFK